MKRFLAAALLTASLLAAVQMFADTNILANPGFESGTLSPWFNDRNFCTGNCQPWAIDSTNPHSGSFDAMNVGNIELRQNFTPVAASSISQISFWMEHPDGAGLPMAIDLFYTNGEDDEFTVFSNDANYDFFDITANLNTSLTLEAISFFGVSDSGTSITFLDDVSILAGGAPPPVPEPASLLMLGSGLLMGVGALRRKLNR